MNSTIPPQVSPSAAGAAAMNVPADQLADAIEWTMDYLETIISRAGSLGLPVPSKFNTLISLKIIRDIHGLPETACCADIVAKVRETKALTQGSSTDL